MTELWASSSVSYSGFGWLLVFDYGRCSQMKEDALAASIVKLSAISLSSILLWRAHPPESYLAANLLNTRQMVSFYSAAKCHCYLLLARLIHRDALTIALEFRQHLCSIIFELARLGWAIEERGCSTTLGRFVLGFHHSNCCLLWTWFCNATNG